ncbi:hypothetical protein Sango_0611800 [Sesamum angolense]|uniref:RING-type domain-containing protein n=1 Tax=Sesamum angolense TaxID=2727404 RepID=A0AAE2C1Z2_9LAMI|nr:hypothetical protein Sango_0611800 [Sesamum angolense]
MRHNNSGSMESIPMPVSIDIREFIADDNNSRTVKGKGVIIKKNLYSCRSFRSSSEKVVETSYYTRNAGKSIEEPGDWRSKRNGTRKMNISSFVVEKLVPRHASEHHKDKDVRVQPLRQSTSHPRAEPGQLDGHCSVVTTLTTKQKQGSTSRTLELGRNSHDEDARFRQVEADEVLARELQEQFYNEVPILGVGQRGSLRSNSQRQRQSRPSSNRPRRRSQARASTSRRMTRLRGRFPGQPRSLLPTRGGNSLFPSNMDADMRHLLGALETFSDLGVGSRILQTRRNFNENDYEMLLSLDENNNQQRGASVHHINGLPQSTVQSDNFEEACAICLETPTIGDTIRHLPCLHKFHKDEYIVHRSVVKAETVLPGLQVIDYLIYSSRLLTCFERPGNGMRRQDVYSLSSAKISD